MTVTETTIEQLKITTNLIAERDTYRRDFRTTTLVLQEVAAERDSLRRALEKAADAQDGCPTPRVEKACPLDDSGYKSITCQECWITYYKEEEE